MMENKKITRYFTFGQAHEHTIGDKLFNKDVIVEITDENPREKMFSFFGGRWAFEYKNKPDMSYFSRGVIKIK